MKTTKKILIAFLTVLLLCLTVFSFWGCYQPFHKALAIDCVEWSDQSGKICFRRTSGDVGYGYIELFGERVPAAYYFNRVAEGGILVSIAEEDYPEACQDRKVRNGMVSDMIGVRDLNENNQLATLHEVDLFGVNFGKLTISSKPIASDEFEVWEHDWRQEVDPTAPIRFGEGTVILWKNNCSHVTVYPVSDEWFGCVIKWLPERKEFELYRRNEETYGVPSEDEEPIAKGRYGIENNVLTLSVVSYEGLELSTAFMQYQTSYT